MLQNHLNYFLAVLYCRNRATMKSSGDGSVMTIAKMQLGALLFFYVLPLVGIVGRLWTHREIDTHITSSNTLDSVLEMAVLFVPVQLMAWPTERLVAFATDVDQQDLLQQAQRTLVLLLVVGLVWLIVSAKYCTGTL